jgi:site-specific recombinase XerD
MLLSEAGADFLQYCAAECGHTTSTIKAYRQAIRRFREWLVRQGHGDPDVRQVTPSLARKYMYYLDGLGLRPRTRLHLFLPLRGLYRMLTDHGAVEKNAFLEVRLPKKDAAQRLLVSDDELSALLEAATRQPDPLRAARDQAVFAMMVYCGLRRSELLDLRVSDIDPSEGTLLIRMGKGQKSRRIWLCGEAKQIIARWLELRPPCRHDYLFMVDYNRRLADNGLKSLIDMVKAIAGYGDAAHIACHSIRHAAATRLMRNGADLASIQHFLGHSQLQTTAVYLHTNEQQLQKIASLAGLARNVKSGGLHASPPEERLHGAAHRARRRPVRDYSRDRSG